MVRPPTRHEERIVVEWQSQPPAAWRDLARHSGRFYDDPTWIEGLPGFFGYPLHCLTALQGDSVVGGLALARVPALLGPSRLVSLPFSYAGGVIGGNHVGVGDALFDAARRLALDCRVKRVEIKQRAGGGEVPAGFVRHHHYAFYRVSTVGGDEAMWTRLHASTQRSVVKGQKAGVVALATSDEQGWLTMAVLHEANARRHGVPAPPRAFFSEFCRGLQHEGLADLYLARLSDQRIAAGVVVWKGSREWIYAFGASDPRLLEHRPNHVLIWQALRDAARAGVEFDLGRAAPEQAGLVEFKRRWGGQQMPLAYDYWPAAAGLNVRRRDGGLLAFAAGVWSSLPPAVARLAAPLYRYLG